MNAKQRRGKRRFIKKVIRDHKRGLRGTWQYRHGSKSFNFQVEFWDSWVGVYTLGSGGEVVDLLTAYWTEFPKWAEKLSFLRKYKNPGLNEYPAYKLDGTNYLLVPHDNATSVRWVRMGSWWDGSFRLIEVPFDEVFKNMTDAQKAEAMWHLDVIAGE